MCSPPRVVLFMLVVFAPAFATSAVIAQEDFSYANGNVAGANGGTGWASPWSSSGLEVLNGYAFTNVFNNPPKYGARNFPQYNGELFFVRFDLHLPSLGLNDYWGAALTVGVNNNILTAGKWPGNTVFSVGNGGLASTSIPASPGDYLVVAAYHNMPVGQDRLMIWINPDALDFYDPSTGTGSADAVQLEPVFFGPATLTLYSNVADVRFDNLVLADGPQSAGISTSPPNATLTSIVVTQGQHLGGNLASLASSDNNRFAILCDEYDSTGEAILTASSPLLNPSTIQGTFETRASRNDLSQFVRIRNYATSAYDPLDFRTSSLTDVTFVASIAGASHVSASGEMKIQFLWIPQGDIDAADGWSMGIDLVSLGVF